MPSGGRRMVFNTQERVVSTDQNRQQAFIGKDRAELWRYLIDVSAGTDDLDAAALDTEYSTQENPLRAEILNGVLVQPQSGTLNLLVTPGAAFVLDPDASPSSDDSPYKFIRTAGVSTLGALALTGNASGFTRIDVVECQRVENTVETDNRDIFNPVTQLFTATTVTKGLQSEFTYRVRAGTPNAGFPGTAQGWLPIAVISVPNGATSCDQCTFWDVRPLVSDRAVAPFNVSRDLSRKGASMGMVDFTAGQAQLSGVFERVAGSRRLGGRMRPGSTITDAQFVDLVNAANIANGQMPANNSYYYVWLLTPFSLPRWARYTDGPSGRVPRSPRGIPVVSNVAPDKNGNPIAAVALPSALGLGGTTSSAAFVCCGRTDGSGTPRPMLVDGSVQWASNNGDAPQINNSAFTATSFTWSLADNTHFPANARAILARIQLWPAVATLEVLNLANMMLIVNNAAGREVARIPVADVVAWNFSGTEKDPSLGFALRIPIPNAYTTVTPASYNVTLTWTAQIGSYVIFNNAMLFIFGWDIE